MTIIELLIDDILDEGGVDAIALVERPAHESNWMTFGEDDVIPDYIFINELSGDTGVKIAEEIVKLGETHEDLVEQGYTISKVEIVNPKHQFAFDWSVPNAPALEIGGINKTQGNVTIYSNPNASSGVDSLGADKIRYKYSGPRDNKNRDFCRILLQEARVYREEDMNYMINADFPQYSIMNFRGSYNCRHYWIKLTYTPDKKILNDDRARYGRTGQQDITQEPTETLVTANAKERNYIIDQVKRRLEKEIIQDINAEIVKAGLGDRTLDSLSLIELRVLAASIGFSYNFNRENFKVLDMVDGIPVFEQIEDALKMAELIGCQGVRAHLVDGHYQEGYMPCGEHPEIMSDCGCKKEQFESYDDYPQAARENACKVLKWIDEHGRDEVEGMEQTGLARANQLCKGEKISRETIGRMAAFERHRNNSEINPEYKGTPWKDKGYVAWLGWGGDEGIAWAQRKVEQIDREKMLYENPCQEGYVAYGTKIKDGREVPNCVEEMSIDVNAKPYTNQTGGTLVEEAVFSCEDGVCHNFTTPHQFSTDDERMEITGAAIIPNKLIIRRDEITGKIYYVYFSEETTKKLADKFMRKKYLDKTNLEHTDVAAPDTYVTESWIVDDPEFDKSKKLGLTYPKGTWVITMKVNNKELWKDIKMGEYNGYSVEGMFLEKMVM